MWLEKQPQDNSGLKVGGDILVWFYTEKSPPRLLDLSHFKVIFPVIPIFIKESQSNFIKDFLNKIWLRFLNKNWDDWKNNLRMTQVQKSGGETFPITLIFIKESQSNFNRDFLNKIWLRFLNKNWNDWKNTVRLNKVAIMLPKTLF